MSRAGSLVLAFAIAACTQSSSASIANASPIAKVVHRTARPADSVLRQELTPLQYEVTQQGGTEAPFHNAYWNNHAPGIYVDIVTGEPLFSSTAKFDSGTGWPSFYQTIAPGVVVAQHDASLGMDRTEIRSKLGDSHLGHVFDDGPKPTGLRYCMNSAALRFVPADQLKAQGYGQYAYLFAGARR